VSEASLLDRARQAIVRQLVRRPSQDTTFRLLVPAVGVLTGLSALAIAGLISLLQGILWGSAHDLLAGALRAPWWIRLLVPALGGAAVGGIGWLLRRSVRGAGTPGLIQALALRGGDVSLRQELPGVIAGIVTVSSGGSLGREGPIIDFSAALGSRLGRRFDLTTQQVRVLVCCAAAAAISAVYNAPFGGTIFVMEVLIGSFALEVFGPVVIASVISTLIFRGVMGDLPRFVIPEYELVSLWEFPAYLVLGVLCGLFSVLTIRTMGWMEDGFAAVRRVGYLRPVIGFALVGAIGIVFPYVYGNGAETVNLVLHEELPFHLLLTLPLAKLLATAITRSSGGSGGTFTPTLMLGALLGGAFGYVVHAAFPSQTAEYGAYSLVGMGALLAGITHAPIMAIMMIFEQTNSYSIILPLMLVCIVSNLIARRVEPQSLHLEALRRKGVTLPSGPEAGLLRTLRVSDVMHHDVEAVTERDPLTKVVEHFLRTPRTYLYVTDDEGRFVGAISLHAIKDVLASADSLEIVIAADLVEPFTVLTPRETLADAIEKFWRQHAQRLPVVEEEEPGRLLGWASQRDLMGVYSQEILNKRQLLARFTATDPWLRERSSYVELPPDTSLRTFIVPATLDGRAIRDVAPRSRSGVYVLQISRYDPARGKPAVELPGPDSIVRANDRLVVFGADQDIARLESLFGAESGETDALG
jgi:CIC family chloride channel protein